MEAMKPVMMALQTLAAIEKRSSRTQSDASSKPSAETDAEIAPLIENIGASSVAEIERLVAELQEARNFLQSEGKRIQRETARYINLARTASASVEIMFEAGYPVGDQPSSSASDIVGQPELA
jgi:hypothetical protein